MDANRESKRKPRRKARKILLILLLIVVVLAAGAAGLVTISPAPVALMLRRAFENPSLTALPGYEDVSGRIHTELDVPYPSLAGSNVADFYWPKDQEGPFPVIVWVHGGAFVGGSKSDIREYSKALAYHGYAVVSMAYELAPEAQYPSPLIQTGELYAFLNTVQQQYALDMSNIMFAGDSAGAHIVAQFATIQTSPLYAKETGIAPVITNTDSLKGVLLYCGPYNLVKLATINDGLTSAMLKQAAWAYFGTRSWAQTYAPLATIPDHVTADFPAALITDGNTGSFEADGKELAETLSALGVTVDAYFIPMDEEVTRHEYQFQMNTPAGQASFARTLQFLQAHMQP